MSITTVTAAADVCLPGIGALAADLESALGTGAPNCLDLSQVAAPDLSVVQVVQSPRVSTAQAGQDFALATPAHGMLTALLERARFTIRLLSEDDDFWFHGATAQ